MGNRLGVPLCLQKSGVIEWRKQLKQYVSLRGSVHGLGVHLLGIYILGSYSSLSGSCPEKKVFRVRLRSICLVVSLMSFVVKNGVGINFVPRPRKRLMFAGVLVPGSQKLWKAV